MECRCGFHAKFPRVKSYDIFTFTDGEHIIGHCDRCGAQWLIEVHTLMYQWDADDMQGHGFHFFKVMDAIRCTQCHSFIVALNLWCNEEEWNINGVERLTMEYTFGETSMSADWSEE